MVNISPLSKAEIDRIITAAANEATDCALKWHLVYAELNQLTDEYLGTQGYTADDIYAIRQASHALENMFLRFKGADPLDAVVPETSLAPVVRAVY